MTTSKNVYVAGHTGMVGSAITKQLTTKGVPVIGKPHRELDLKDIDAVDMFFFNNNISKVVIAAATVGGIKDNDKYPVEYLMDNITIAQNLIKKSWEYGVDKLLFLGSSCIYPRLAAQPIKEEYLLTGPLEPTNQWYAIAKIAAIKMCQAYRKQFGSNFVTAMPCNLYGVGDTYDPEKSHVIPGLFCKFQHAFENKLPFVECWGTGNALREFLYVSDMAEAAEVVLDGYNDAEPINIGSGEEISIRELTGMIAKIVGYDGEIRWNSDVPDGTPRKLMDNSKIKSLGWKPKIGLESGLRFAYTDFLIRNSWKSKLKNHLG